MTLYISDLDGTLLHNTAELSDYAARTLNGMIADGLHFSVATARTLVSAGKILSGLTLRLPIVLLNGVLVYSTEQKRYIQIHYLSPKTVEAVISVLRQTDMTAFMYELKNGKLFTYHETLEQQPMRDFVRERVEKYYKTFRHTDSFFNVSAESIIYFTLLDTYDRVKPVHDALAALPGLHMAMYEDTYGENLWYLEIHSDKASKEKAVHFLRETYGFERIVGFGDNLNDLPLFAASDVKVAVENARDKVKSAADQRCESNENDGVVRWIEEDFLTSRLQYHSHL